MKRKRNYHFKIILSLSTPEKNNESKIKSTSMINLACKTKTKISRP